MIDPVGTASSAGTANVSGSRSRLQDVTTAVAKELGMSTDDLEQQLRAGASLDDVAKANGVSHDDLVATITQALQGAPATSGDAQAPSALDQLAERIASAHPHHHGHHHHHVADASADGSSSVAAQPAAATPGDPGIGTVIDELG